MAQDLAIQAVPVLPAAMPAELDTALSVALNKLDPNGLGFTIAAEDAPTPRVLAALKHRNQRLVDCLRPAGKLFVAKRLGDMANVMRKKTRSQREADHAFAKAVDGLADLPSFAIEAAADDFEKGAHGDGWMPDLADFRPHVLTKLAPVSAEKRRIEKVVKAKVRPAKADPARKAEAIRLAREAMKGMQHAGLAAEAERAGKAIEDQKPSESAPQSLERLANDGWRPGPLSPSLRAKFPDPMEKSA